jgi:hypothetical protein
MSTVKLTEEEINNLTIVQNRRKAVSKELSDIGFLRLKLKRKEDKAEDFNNKTIEMEAELAKNLEDKYGRGSVDIESGTFTPFQ